LFRSSRLCIATWIVAITLTLNSKARRGPVQRCPRVQRPSRWADFLVETARASILFKSSRPNRPNILVLPLLAQTHHNGPLSTWVAQNYCATISIFHCLRPMPSPAKVYASFLQHRRAREIVLFHPELCDSQKVVACGRDKSQDGNRNCCYTYCHPQRCQNRVPSEILVFSRDKLQGCWILAYW